MGWDGHSSPPRRTTDVTLPTLHADQVRLFWHRRDARGEGEGADPEWAANAGGRFRAVRCGRRYGKTEFLKTWLCDSAMKGNPVAYFAPTYKYVADAFEQMHELLEPALRRRGGHNKTEGMLRLRTGGSVEFWTLEDPRAGRSRKYKRAGIDEAAFSKNATTEFPKGQALETWRRSIKPALGDLMGSAIVASNTNGVDPTNLLYALCNDPQHEFIEYHAPAWVNPWVPEPWPDEPHEEWKARQDAYYDNLRAREHPLVFAQEYAAEFIDWSGASLFDKQKLLVDGRPVPLPARCDAVFTIIDTSSKTEKGNDGTACTHYIVQKSHANPLLIGDWDIKQIEGGLLIDWLPGVQKDGEALARLCGARAGWIGGWIEDKDSGTVLLQQARRRIGLNFKPIPSDITALGKDGRAISISGYVYRGEIKFTERADKVVVYKGVSRNHLMSQVTGYKLADPEAATRADDLFDTFAYGVMCGLGDSRGW